MMFGGTDYAMMKELDQMIRNWRKPRQPQHPIIEHGETSDEKTGDPFPDADCE